jgi:aminoglycoside 6'-N-acetyltransferase
MSSGVYPSSSEGNLTTDPAIRLRPATDRDWMTIRAWLARPDIQKWWGPSAAAEAEVIMALGSDHAIARMIEVDGQPIGYCHAIDALTWGDQLPEDMPPGTWDLDIVIAEPAFRGRGLGAEALAMLRDEVFSTTLAVAVSVFTSIENESAVRAYEKVGFRWQRVWPDPAVGLSWFMLCERGS